MAFLRAPAAHPHARPAARVEPPARRHLRPLHRRADPAAAPQDRGEPQPAHADPHRARRRLLPQFHRRNGVNAPVPPIDGILVVVAAWFVIGLAGIAALRNFRVVALRALPRVGAAEPGAGRLRPVRAARQPADRGPRDRPAGPALPPAPGRALGLLPRAARARERRASRSSRAATSAPAKARRRASCACSTSVFLAAMAMVLLADDAYAFMVSWEMMALSSFFLVTTNHRIPEIQRAGYLYLLVAHIGAIAILLCFGVLQANTGDYTFANMRAQHLSPLLGLVRVPARALRLRRQGGHPAAAHLAAGGAPGGALAGVGADERRDAEDRDLRHGCASPSTSSRTPLWWWGVVALVRRAGHRALRRGVRRGAGGHEAPARLLLDREHRAHRDGASASRSSSPPTACARSPRSR